MNDKLREALETIAKLHIIGPMTSEQGRQLMLVTDIAEKALAASKQEPQLLQKSFDELAAERRASKQEPQARAEPCPDSNMDEHACKNRHQCWEPCGELGKSEAHVKVHLPQAQAGEPDERLCKFYGVTTYADLVAAQARHIEKLQSKLEPVAGKQLGKARFA